MGDEIARLDPGAGSVTESYRDTVSLLLDVVPATFRSPRLAMKGGTAINLFVLDMPRLSVDIDVAYTRIDVPRGEALQDIADILARVALDLESQGLLVRRLPSGDDLDCRIDVCRAATSVKIEVNTVMRGTVLPIERRGISAAAEARYRKTAEAPILAPAELYGGKLVAALDRQHPRDLFDVATLLAGAGVTPQVRLCFVLYLAAHSRPTHEVLAPRLKDIRAPYENEFQGMALRPLNLTELLHARHRLVSELPRSLTATEMAFLMSIVRGEPDWSAAGIPHAERLPGLQWKLQNVRKLRKANPKKFQANVEALARCLGESHP